jgi:membrane protease subunit (stomatin/prohibitin family)
MGLISAGIGAVSGTLADQWIDFFTAPAFDEQTLVAPGVLRERNSGRGSNKSGSTNIVTDGSRIAVPENTAVIITDGGGIVSVSTEPGYFVFRNDGQPSIFGKACTSSRHRDCADCLSATLSFNVARAPARSCSAL